MDMDITKMNDDDVVLFRAEFSPNATSFVLPWYSTPLFEFERTFDYRTSRKWFRDNWSLCFVYSFVYLALVFIGQKFMKVSLKIEILNTKRSTQVHNKPAEMDFSRNGLHNTCL